MKKIITVLFLLSSFVFGQNAWINEVSYDMTGGDTDDFIEIVAPVGTDMSAYGILLANGNGDLGYGYVQLSGIITSTNATNGFGFMILLTNQSTSVTIPVGCLQQSSGFSSIQNGGPDGVLLINHSTGAVIHGIWYEEAGTPPTLIGANSYGPSGSYSMLNVDVTSALDDGGSPIGQSLSMIGDGLSHTWNGEVISTVGAVNIGQSALPVELTTFSASVSDNSVELNWETATEVNNYGFNVERKPETGQWSKVGFVEGHGNSNSPKYYVFADTKLEASGKYFYRLKQVDIDGSYEYSDIVEANLGTPNNIELNQNFPNPFNPTTSIQFNLPADSQVRLSVFNVLGEEVAELLNDNIAAGYHSIKFDASNFNSGIYFYKLESGNFLQIRKMMLVK